MKQMNVAEGEMGNQTQCGKFLEEWGDFFKDGFWKMGNIWDWYSIG